MRWGGNAPGDTGDEYQIRIPSIEVSSYLLTRSQSGEIKVILSDFDKFRDNPMVKFKTEIVEGKSYTIISYMIADKSFWEVPLSLETRGITFETKTGICVSRPLGKFFNVSERSDTDPASVARDFVECYEKRDGSMLTPIITQNGNIVFKTKKSFYSDVANSANLSVPEEVKRV